jgi:hypothetical protein
LDHVIDSAHVHTELAILCYDPPGHQKRTEDTYGKAVQNDCGKTPEWVCCYPRGMQGIVVGEGDTNEAALADMTSALRFYIESESPILEAFIAETGVII